MNKREVNELKRRFKKDDATFTRLCGCYVDGNRNKVSKLNQNFLNLEEDEYFKYLEIAKKTLSGKIGNNLLDLEFPLDEEKTGGRQQILMALRDTKLENEDLLDAFYDKVIDTYDFAGNYLILLYHDAYDVMKRTSDNQNLDESEEVFDYIICAICPVNLSKPGLGYREDEQRIGARDRDWVVAAPDTAFLFPAFNDRTTDIHSTLFYTKNAKEPHSEFMANGLGCDPERTSTEQHDIFLSMLGNVLGMEEDLTGDFVLDVNLGFDTLLQEAEQEGNEAPIIIDEKKLETILNNAEIPEDRTKRIIKNYNEVFAGDYPTAEALCDQRLLANSELLLENRRLKEENFELKQKIHGNTEE